MISPISSASFLAIPCEIPSTLPPPTNTDTAAVATATSSSRNFIENKSTVGASTCAEANASKISAAMRGSATNDSKRQKLDSEWTDNLLPQSSMDTKRQNGRAKNNLHVTAHPHTPPPCQNSDASAPLNCDLSSMPTTSSVATANITEGSSLKLYRCNETTNNSPLLFPPNDLLTGVKHTGNGRAQLHKEGGKSRHASVMVTSLNDLLLRMLPSQLENDKKQLAMTSVGDDGGAQIDMTRRKSQQQTPSEGSADSGASPTSSRTARKLKIYTVEEKLDIVDFALTVGNRAAGREYGVAESSIREWRKNEKKYRQNLLNNHDKTKIQFVCPWVIKEIDTNLLKFAAEQKDNGVDWYDIREKARSIWLDILKSGRLSNTGYTESAINFTMGWVTRFMNRNAGTVANIPKPVVATAAAVNNITAQMNLQEQNTSNENSQISTPTTTNSTNGNDTILRSRGGTSAAKRQLTGSNTSTDSAKALPSKRTKKMIKKEPALDILQNILSDDQPDDQSELSSDIVQNSTLALPKKCVATSSRRKCQQPRRLTLDDENLGLSNKIPPTLDTMKLTEQPGGENLNLINNNSAAAIQNAFAQFSKLWMNGSGTKSAVTSPQSTKHRPENKIETNEKARSTHEEFKAIAITPNQRQLQQQRQNQQQQQYSNLFTRQLATMLAAAPNLASPHNNNNNGAMPNAMPLSLFDNNMLAVVQLLQNIQHFSSKDNLKLS